MSFAIDSPEWVVISLARICEWVGRSISNRPTAATKIRLAQRKLKVAVETIMFRFYN